MNNLSVSAEVRQTEQNRLLTFTSLIFIIMSHYLKKSFSTIIMKEAGRLSS